MNSTPSPAYSQASTSSPMAESPPPDSPARSRLRSPYVRQLTEDTLTSLGTDGKSPDRQVQLVYEYLVSAVTFTDPVGPDCWQYRGSPGDPPPPYLEQRALSPLAFGAGSCEDYAAAMTLLLQGLGLNARYLPGLTVSVEHTWVDHAWTMVELNGRWYHLDPQLERNVLKGNRLTYRYFLRSDSEMQSDHLWGDSWIAYGMAGSKPLTDTQREEITRLYTPEPSVHAYPSPPARELKLSPPPDLAAIEARLLSEKQRFEQLYGALTPHTPDILPPVFGVDATTATGAPMGPIATARSLLLYNREQLSEPLRTVYDLLVQAAGDWQTDIPISLPRPVDTADFSHVWGAFLREQPLFYWASCSPRTNASGQVVSFVLEPPAGVPVTLLRQQQRELEETAARLLDGVSGDRYQQVCMLYDRLVQWVQYTSEPGVQDIDNPYGALVGRQGLCNGISQAFQYLAQLQNIPTLYIPGSTAWGTTHAWNAVLLEDGWYYLDVTWGRSERPDVVFHDYLLITRAEMDAEHIPLVSLTAQLPDADLVTNNYYLRSGSYADTPLDNPDALAEAFLPLLAAAKLTDTPRQLYTEVKIGGSEQDYAITRSFFVKNIFALIKSINSAALRDGLPLRVEENRQVVFDYNDVTRTLSMILFVGAN